MSNREYCVYNETRENLLSPRVAFIDTRSDPLKAVKVLIEGLAPNADTGLWLNPMKSVPAVPRLTAYDLVYLDRDGCVVHGVELVPDDEAPKFEGAAASALVLPIHSFAASQAVAGDRFVLRPAEEMPAVGAAIRTRTQDLAPTAARAVEPIAKVQAPPERAKENPAALVACARMNKQISPTPAAGKRAAVMMVASAPEPNAALDTIVVGKVAPEQFEPLTRPVKWCAQSTALEPVNPLGEIRLPARKAPRFALLYRIAHLRIRVQISVSTVPAAAQGFERPRLERNAGASRAGRLVRISKNAMAGVRTGGARGAAVLGDQWIACKAAYFRWAESFMFRPAQKAASMPPTEMLPPSLSYTRKPRFLR